MVQQANLARNSARQEDMSTTIQDQDDLVEALRSGVAGRVLSADDAECDETRTPNFPVRIGKPVAVVGPKHVDDVAVVVDAARRAGLPLFVCSGAHHGAAHSTGDGLLIDLRSLNNLDIDVAGQSAWAETGLTTREMAWALRSVPPAANPAANTTRTTMQWITVAGIAPGGLATRRKGS
jgi:FAD/FMN-containing dehydrogenase